MTIEHAKCAFLPLISPGGSNIIILATPHFMLCISWGKRQLYYSWSSYMCLFGRPIFSHSSGQTPHWNFMGTLTPYCTIWGTCMPHLRVGIVIIHWLIWDSTQFYPNLLNFCWLMASHLCWLYCLYSKAIGCKVTPSTSALLLVLVLCATFLKFMIPWCAVYWWQFIGTEGLVIENEMFKIWVLSVICQISPLWLSHKSTSLEASWESSKFWAICSWV